jgi:hypothetical protein
MAVNKPDEYKHANPGNAFVDSDFVRGGRRFVMSRAELYELADKVDQLKEHVTIVRVVFDEEYNGAATNMLLVDISKVGEPDGWQLDNPGETVQTIPPVYTIAQLELEQSATVYGEVGELLENVLKATFIAGDAGPVNALKIKENGVQLGQAVAANSLTRTSSFARRPFGIVRYEAFVDHAAGPRKRVVPINTLDIREPRISDPNAPQAAWDNQPSNEVRLISSYKIFYGPSADQVTTGDQARALPYSELSTYEGELVLRTGLEHTRFSILLPPGVTVKTIIDKKNCYADYTEQYEDKGKVLVPDAGGALVEYTALQFKQAVPYVREAAHHITFAFELLQ